MVAMLDNVETVLERRAIFLGLLARLRGRELRGLQGRHFWRDGLIEVPVHLRKGARLGGLPSCQAWLTSSPRFAPTSGPMSRAAVAAAAEPAHE
jgi:hypothetical protein